MSPMAATTLAAVLALVMITSRPCYAQQVGLRIRPTSSDTGKFVGQEFSRVCALTVSNVAVSRIEWRQDGVTVETGTESSLSLNRNPVRLEHAGMYTCIATLTNGTTLGPANAGRLSVFDTSPIMAPTNQYLIYGSESTTLICSYADSSITLDPVATVERDDELVSGNTIIQANLDDEGEYECDIFLPGHQASIGVLFTVHVIVPIQITSSPPGETNIYNKTGTQRTFSVDFTGRVEQELQITWEKDGRPLPADYQVTTTYNGFNSPPTGRTSLSFSTIQRKDSGVYRVVFNSTLGAESLPSHLLTNETSFQVNVEVPPSKPGNFRVDRSSITSVFARILWDLTNQTADAGADKLTLLLTYSNMSLVQEIELPGNAERVALDLIPGTEYVVQLRAENPDGMAITNALSVQTLNGNPKVNEISVRQLGASLATFEVSTSLAYTGGGAIISFDVSYRRSTSGEFRNLKRVTATSSGDPLVWTGTYTIADDDFDPSTGVENIQFLVFVNNQFGYQSNGSFVSATASEPTTTSNTVGTGASGSADLPFWLYIVVAVLGSVLITITILFACFFIIRGCRKSRRQPKNMYKVNSQNKVAGLSDVSMQDPESGGQLQRYVQCVPEPVTVPNNAHSLPHSTPQPFEQNIINSLHHNGSMPSIKTNSSSPTPQPDDPLLKKPMYINHQKCPSDASSITKRGPTPSTTASSSPAPAAMKAAYERQIQTESGRASSISSSVQHMEQYLPQLVEQGSGEIEAQQSSQTESENVHIQMQNETCSCQYHHQRHDSQQFSDRHSHQSLNISQSGSYPLYRVGTSTSNTSVPTCSSIQGSHPSLINSSGPLCHQFPTPHHHHHPGIPGYPSSSYVLPAGSVTGRAESLCSYTTIGGDSILSGHGSHHPSICDSQLQTTV